MNDDMGGMSGQGMGGTAMKMSPAEMRERMAAMAAELAAA